MGRFILREDRLEKSSPAATDLRRLLAPATRWLLLYNLSTEDVTGLKADVRLTNKKEYKNLKFDDEPKSEKIATLPLAEKGWLVESFDITFTQGGKSHTFTEEAGGPVVVVG